MCERVHRKCATRGCGGGKGSRRTTRQQPACVKDPDARGGWRLSTGSQFDLKNINGTMAYRKSVLVKGADMAVVLATAGAFLNL